MMTNTDDVEIQPTHGPGSKLKLLLPDKGSSRDKLAAAHIIASLYSIEFDPGIDNFPNHHDQEEEIYYRSFYINGVGGTRRRQRAVPAVSRSWRVPGQPRRQPPSL
jgi:hypothetical protein